MRNFSAQCRQPLRYAKIIVIFGFTFVFTSNQGILAGIFFYKHISDSFARNLAGIGAGLVTWIPLAICISALSLMGSKKEEESSEKPRRSVCYQISSYIYGGFIALLCANKALNFGGLGMLACQTANDELGWTSFGTSGVQYTYGVLGILCNLTYFWGVVGFLRMLLEAEIKEYKGKNSAENDLQSPLVQMPAAEARNSKMEQALRVLWGMFVSALGVVGIINFGVPATMAANRWGYGAAAVVTAPISIVQMALIQIVNVYPVARNLGISDSNQSRQLSKGAHGSIWAFSFISSFANVLIMEQYIQTNNVTDPTAQTFYLISASVSWTFACVFGITFFTKGIKEKDGVKNYFRSLLRG